MNKKKFKINPRLSFNQKVCKKVNKLILDEEGFYHNRTRWFRMFNQLQEDKQLEVIEEVVKLQFDWVADSINKQVTPIELEAFGKFRIRPGKRDFVELCSAEDFDGDYRKVCEEVQKRIDKRREEKYFKRKEERKAKLNGET